MNPGAAALLRSPAGKQHRAARTRVGLRGHCIGFRNLQERHRAGPVIVSAAEDGVAIGAFMVVVRRDDDDLIFQFRVGSFDVPEYVRSATM